MMESSFLEKLPIEVVANIVSCLGLVQQHQCQCLSQSLRGALKNVVLPRQEQAYLQIWRRKYENRKLARDLLTEETRETLDQEISIYIRNHIIGVDDNGSYCGPTKILGNKHLSRISQLLDLGGVISPSKALVNNGFASGSFTNILNFPWVRHDDFYSYLYDWDMQYSRQQHLYILEEIVASPCVIWRTGPGLGGHFSIPLFLLYYILGPTVDEIGNNLNRNYCNMNRNYCYTQQAPLEYRLKAWRLLKLMLYVEGTEYNNNGGMYNLFHSGEECSFNWDRARHQRLLPDPGRHIEQDLFFVKEILEWMLAESGLVYIMEHVLHLDSIHVDAMIRYDNGRKGDLVFFALLVPSFTQTILQHPNADIIKNNEVVEEFRDNFITYSLKLVGSNKPFQKLFRKQVWVDPILQRVLLTTRPGLEWMCRRKDTKLLEQLITINAQAVYEVSETALTFLRQFVRGRKERFVRTFQTVRTAGDNKARILTEIISPAE